MAFSVRKVKYFKFGNTPNINVIGSLKNDKGVVSGFTVSDYAQLPGIFNPGTSKWEFYTYVTVGAIDTQQYIFCSTGHTYQPFGLSIRSNNTIRFEVWNPETSAVVVDFETGLTVEANKGYYIKVGFSGSIYTIYTSEDGVTYTSQKSASSNTPVASGYGIAMGSKANSSLFPWLGSIDFTKTKLIVNGETWWNGVKGDEIPKPTNKIEADWTNPKITANGVLGGNSFAVTDWDAAGMSTEPYVLFGPSGTYSTAGSAPSPDIFPIKVTIDAGEEVLLKKLTFKNGTGIGTFLPVKPAHLLEVYATNGDYSKDSTDWILLKEYENTVETSGSTWTIDLSDNETFYKYYMISFLDLSNTKGLVVAEITMEGKNYVYDYDYRTYKDTQYMPAIGYYADFENILNTSTAGAYSFTLTEESLVNVVLVGGGGAAAMRGVYDDRGYGWSGGSGGAYQGQFTLPAGTYTAVVGSANNNTTGQSGNTQTLNPSDSTTHDTYISGVVRVGGGGSGHYNSNYVGAAGAAATFEVQPNKTIFNLSGNVGKSGSGGKGSAAAATVAGGASVYNGHGQGQGCKTSEYAAKRSWINGTNGYINISAVAKRKHDKMIQACRPVVEKYGVFKITSTTPGAVIKINGKTTDSLEVIVGREVEWSVEAEGYIAQTGKVFFDKDTTITIELEKYRRPLNKYVAIAYQNTIGAVSDDGINWTATTLPAAHRWISLAAGDGKIIALAEGGQMAYTENGVDWVELPGLSSAYWAAITYGNGRYVAVAGTFMSSSNKVAYSDDGINWTEIKNSNNLSKKWMSITYGDGWFVAVSENGPFMCSEDGINWLELAVDEAAWQSITYSNGYFVAIAYKSTLSCWSKSVTTLWGNATMPLSQDWYTVGQLNGKFVALGSRSATGCWMGGGNVFGSWSTMSMPSDAGWHGVCGGADKFVAVAGTTDEAAYSPDGINWTTTTMPASINWYSVIYG